MLDAYTHVQLLSTEIGNINTQISQNSAWSTAWSPTWDSQFTTDLLKWKKQTLKGRLVRVKTLIRQVEASMASIRVSGASSLAACVANTQFKRYVQILQRHVRGGQKTYGTYEHDHDHSQFRCWAQKPRVRHTHGQAGPHGRSFENAQYGLGNMQVNDGVCHLTL